MFSENASGDWLRRSLHKFIWDFQCLASVYRGFSVGRDSLEVKKIIKVKFFWMNYSCHGWTFLWVGECVLGKTPKGCFSWYLELDCGPKVIPQFAICSKFTGEHPCWSAISTKLQSNFIEVALRHGCAPVNLLHIFRTYFPKNTSEGLFLPIDFVMI